MYAHHMEYTSGTLFSDPSKPKQRPLLADVVTLCGQCHEAAHVDEHGNYVHFGRDLRQYLYEHPERPKKKKRKKRRKRRR